MTCRSKWIFASLCLTSLTCHALSQRTADIFRKENRHLEPPPKSLRANSEEPALRYKEGSERVARRIADDGNEPSASVSLTPVDESAYDDDKDKDADDDSERPKKRSLRHARSVAPVRRKTEGFSGDRMFGLGFMGAGAYGVYGGEVDFGLNSDWTAGFGLGTGMSYSTWAAHARYFTAHTRWSPMVEMGYAQWHLGRVPQDGTKIIPNHIAQRFFADETGVITGSKTINILYPGIGVLYQHRSGLAALMELQYFIHARDFTGALFGTFGGYFYF